MASLVPGARGLGRGLVPRLSLRRLSLSCSLPARGEQPIHIRRRTEAARAGPSAANILEDEQKGVFRVKNIQPPKREEWKQFKRGPGGPVPPPRAAEMVPGQAWGDVWPAARTFHPATVPLPVRQGVIQTKQQVVPSKWANAELLKVVNFLHLTPPVVAKHCAALTKFCTAWPRGLETEEDTEHHFPLTVVTSDHLNSGSSVRDRRARIVTLQFKVDSLSLDGRARDKFIRLVGERWGF
jgi:small subunit ribosomal protein S35